MSAVDSIARSAAKKAIETYGKAVVFRSRTVGAQNAATLKADVSENAYTMRALIEAYAAREVNGTSIKTGDFKLTVASKGNELPVPGWFVDFPFSGIGAVFKVVSVEPVFSGEDIAIAVVQVRK